MAPLLEMRGRTIVNRFRWIQYAVFGLAFFSFLWLTMGFGLRMLVGFVVVSAICIFSADYRTEAKGRRP